MSQSDGIGHMGLRLCLASIVADAARSDESADVKMVSSFTEVTNTRQGWKLYPYINTTLD